VQYRVATQRWSGLLLVALLGVLLGRAYQHLLFEGPYRAFFLDEQLFGWAVESYSGKGSWTNYVLSLKTDARILVFTRIVGGLFGITALLFAVFWRSRPRWLWPVAILNSLLLLFLAFGYFLETGYQAGQWIEYSAQIAMPVLAIWAARPGMNRAFRNTAYAVIALTFTGHGLYALGFHPVPGDFVYMLTRNLPLTDTAAKSVLYVAGWLDLAVALGVFIPSLRKYALLYAFFWGGLTTFARLTSYLVFGHLFWLTVHQWVFQFLVRLPHFLLPLFLWRNDGSTDRLADF